MTRALVMRCVRGLGLLSLSVACRGDTVPTLAPAEHRRILEWLRCEECWNSERIAVRQLGARAIPTLTKYLRDGPSDSVRQIMRVQFLAGYTTRTPGSVSRQQYAQMLEDNFTANYQIRSAMSLADIGGSDAFQALDEAARDSAARSYRGDVMAALRRARDRIAANAFPGRVVTPLVGFGDTVIIEGPAASVFSGDERAAVDGSLYDATDAYLFNQGNRLGFLALGRGGGSQTVTVTGIGASNTTQVLPLTITTMLDRNDRGMVRCPLLNRQCQIDSAPRLVFSSGPRVEFLSLWRDQEPPDTMDIFRIEPTTSIDVTARIDWRPALPPSTPSNVMIGWQSCAPFVISGSGSFVPVPNPTQITRSIPAGDCWLLIVRLRVGGAQSVFARLRLSSP